MPRGMTIEQHHADTTWAIKTASRTPALARTVFEQIGKPALVEACRRLSLPHKRTDKIATLEDQIVAHFESIS